MPHRIVILGGGFAGLNTALHLRRLTRQDPDLSITLISRDNYFLMTPLLFEAGSGILEPRHVVHPIRPLFGRDGPRFVEAEVLSVDLDQKLVHARLVHVEPIDLPYDTLVLALGGVTNTSLIPGSDRAMTFKTLADAIGLRNHVIQNFEQADVEKDEARKRSLMTFVIIGAGLVGSELQGELSEFARAVARNYPNVDETQLRFELIEAGPRIMAELDEALATYATEQYRKRGINVRLNTKVASIEPDHIKLPDGEVIASTTIVLAAGVVPSPILGRIDLEKDRKGRVIVDSAMRSKSRPEIWALGDCASIPDPDNEGKFYPPLAQHALREARTIAKNIVAAMRNQPTKPFTYRTLGTLASLGHFKAVGRVFGVKLKGFPAWLVWRTYYLMQMPRWSRRFRIMLDWTVALVYSYDVVQLDLIATDRVNRKVAEEGRPRIHTDGPAVATMPQHGKEKDIAS